MGRGCWCCDRVLANERFGERGHARHVCKACSRIGAEERAIRQVQRDVDRAAMRGRRVELEGFLRHADERVWRRAAGWLSTCWRAAPTLEELADAEPADGEEEIPS